jgi:hypothetical protein
VKLIRALSRHRSHVGVEQETQGLNGEQDLKVTVGIVAV